MLHGHWSGVQVGLVLMKPPFKDVRCCDFWCRALGFVGFWLRALGVWSDFRVSGLGLSLGARCLFLMHTHRPLSSSFLWFIFRIL